MNWDSLEMLKRGIEGFSIEVNDEIIERFDIYASLLVEWNNKMNLTAITDEKEIVIKHFIDSISCVQANYVFSKRRVADVGTGAGFPGVPLKIIYNDMYITLMDSLNKRVVFLNELMENLGIKCNIIHGRAEDLGRDKRYRETYDIVLSRAVANMAVLSEYTLPFAKVGGVVLCQKGPGVFDEVKDAGNAIKILGGGIKEILSTNVYKGELSHYIAIIEKIKTCPEKYPRKAGVVEKNPIR